MKKLAVTLCAAALVLVGAGAASAAPSHANDTTTSLARSQQALPTNTSAIFDID